LKLPYKNHFIIALWHKVDLDTVFCTFKWCCRDWKCSRIHY